MNVIQFRPKSSERVIVSRPLCKFQGETEYALRYVVDYVDEDGATCALVWDGLSRLAAFEAAREWGVRIVDRTGDPR
jgi:YD repeat-containing protein